MPYFTATNHKNLENNKIFYTDNKPEKGEQGTILFIHGLGSSSSFYHTIIPYLSSVFRCIALDTRGSGLSKLTALEKQSISTIAPDAVGLLEALEIHEKVTVVGHSMGGIVASHFAASYPDRVNGVVLIGPVDPNPALSDVFEKRIEMVMKADGLETLAATVPTAATGEKAGPLEHAFIRSLILGTSPESYISLCRVIATAKPPPYESITCPLLIIAGADDKTSPMSGCEAIFNAYGTKMEQKNIEVVEGIGHWICIEAPGQVERLIQRFIVDKLLQG